MQTVSDMSSKGIDASEVSSELKSNRQDEDESLLKDSKMDATVVQNDDSMPKSGLESEVSSPKSTSDFIMISEVMDESNDESSAEEDKTAEDKGKCNWSSYIILVSFLLNFFESHCGCLLQMKEHKIW